MKNKNLIKLIIILVSFSSVFSVFFYQKSIFNNSLINFQQYIIHHHKTANVSISNDCLHIKDNQNPEKLLKMIIQMNMRINLVNKDKNKIEIYAKPEESFPKIIYFIKNETIIQGEKLETKIEAQSLIIADEKKIETDEKSKNKTKVKIIYV